jgi:alkenylglycerophosphocholine hydrolase
LKGALTIKTFRLFQLLAIISGLIHFALILTQFQVGIYITKPLTMLFIIGICLAAYREGAYRRHAVYFLLGLIFSLIGDVLLMLPGGHLFIPGLFAFLVAHVFYIIGLWTDHKNFRQDNISALILLLLAATVGAYLYPYLPGAMLAPVLMYVIVISLMVWKAVGSSFRDYFGKDQQKLIIVGAILFYLSDLILAVNRFAIPIPYSSLAVMIPYFSAQYLLASSVKR